MQFLEKQPDRHVTMGEILLTTVYHLMPQVMYEMTSFWKKETEGKFALPQSVSNPCKHKYLQGALSYSFVTHHLN